MKIKNYIKKIWTRYIVWLDIREIFEKEKCVGMANMRRIVDVLDRRRQIERFLLRRHEKSLSTYA